MAESFDILAILTSSDLRLLNAMRSWNGLMISLKIPLIYNIELLITMSLHSNTDFFLFHG